MSWLMDWIPTAPPQETSFNPYSDPHYIPGGWPSSPSETNSRKRKPEVYLTRAQKRFRRAFGEKLPDDTPEEIEMWEQEDNREKLRKSRAMFYPHTRSLEARKSAVPAPQPAPLPPQIIIPLSSMSPNQRDLLLSLRDSHGEQVYPEGVHRNPDNPRRQPPFITDAPAGIAEAYSVVNAQAEERALMEAREVQRRRAEALAPKKQKIRPKWGALKSARIRNRRLPTPEPEEALESNIEKGYVTDIFHNMPVLAPSNISRATTPDHEPLNERSDQVTETNPHNQPWSIDTSSPIFISSDSEVSSLDNVSPIMQPSSDGETLPSMHNLSVVDPSILEDTESSPSRQLYQELNATLTEVLKLESNTAQSTPDHRVRSRGSTRAAEHMRRVDSLAYSNFLSTSPQPLESIESTSQPFDQSTSSHHINALPGVVLSEQNTAQKGSAQQLKTPVSVTSSAARSSVGRVSAEGLHRATLQNLPTSSSSNVNHLVSTENISTPNLSDLSITEALPIKVITPKAEFHSSERLRRTTRLRALKEQALQEALNQYEIVPLSQEWDEKVKMAVRQGSGKYSASDLARVVPQYASRGQDNWLNDEAINGYLELVVAHGKKNDRDTQTPSHHAFNSFFYTNLSQKGPQSIARWAKRAKIAGKDLLKVEKVFIPINAGAHWTLAVVDGTKKTITHYNSLRSGSTGIAVCENVKKWVAMELGKEWREEEWGVLAVGESPQQTNSDDCGVFTVTSARQIMLGFTPASYQAGQIETQRKRIVAELVAGRLLRSRRE